MNSSSWIFRLIWPLLLCGTFDPAAAQDEIYCQYNDMYLMTESTLLLHDMKTRELHITNLSDGVVHKSGLYYNNVATPFGPGLLTYEARPRLNGFNISRKIYEISEELSEDVESENDVALALNVAGDSFSLVQNVRAGTYRPEDIDLRYGRLPLDKIYFLPPPEGEIARTVSALLLLDVDTSDLFIMDVVEDEPLTQSQTRGVSPQWYHSADAKLRARRVTKNVDAINTDFRQSFQIPVGGIQAEPIHKVEGQSQEWTKLSHPQGLSDDIVERVSRETRWQTVFTIDRRYEQFDPYFYPLANDQENTFWAISNRGRTQSALVRVDAQTGEEDVIFQRKNHDVEEVFFSTHFKEPLYVKTAGALPDYIALEPRFQTVFEKLKPNAPFAVDYKGMDETGVLFQYDDNVRGTGYVYVPFDKGPPQYLGFNCSEGHAVEDKYILSTELVYSEEQNGMEQAGFLTYPREASRGKSVPLVVIINDSLERRLPWADHPDRLAHRFPAFGGRNEEGEPLPGYDPRLPVAHPEQNVEPFWVQSDRQYWLSEGFAVFELLPWGMSNGHMVMLRSGKEGNFTANNTSLYRVLESLITSEKIQGDNAVLISSGVAAGLAVDLVKDLPERFSHLVLDAPIFEAPELGIGAGRGYTERLLRHLNGVFSQDILEGLEGLPPTLVLSWPENFFVALRLENHAQCGVVDALQAASVHVQTAKYGSGSGGGEFWFPEDRSKGGTSNIIVGAPFHDGDGTRAEIRGRRQYLIQQFLMDVGGQLTEALPLPDKYFGFVDYGAPCD